MKITILCDFDGTIIDIDIAEYALHIFGEGEWWKHDEELEEGLINLEECMQRQYETIKVPESKILTKTTEKIQIRSGFNEFVKLTKSQNIELIIVSAGLDFIIRDLLEKNGWQHIPIIAAQAKCSFNGMKLTFPKKKDSLSPDFKVDTVKNYQSKGHTVYYIGDGLSDFSAVRVANFSFVLKDSSLALLCKQEKLNSLEYKDFNDIINILQELIKSKRNSY
jgi:HAD superfamily phosphoserine phosphatase-like hydrolase